MSNNKKMESFFLLKKNSANDIILAKTAKIIYPDSAKETTFPERNINITSKGTKNNTNKTYRNVSKDFR